MEFRHTEIIPVRFRDLDAMGHVNNAVYMTYLEMARIGYYRAVTGEARPETAFILARVECDYRSPTMPGETVAVACGTTRLGGSSMTMAYRLTEAASGRLLAEAQSVQVTFDYEASRPMPLPQALRDAIVAFEGRAF